LLFALDSTTTVLIHAYKLNPIFNDINIHRHTDTLPIASIIAKDVVKYGMSVNVKSSDLYVAPTFNNSELSTFWVSDANQT
jgi:hypothetical protein